jgi:predicted protein tyrosine phosphatase
MPRIHVCSLSRIDEIVRATGARTLVTLINEGTPVPRPASIAPERHLHVSMSDVVEELEGHVAPHDGHVGSLLDFIHAWDRADPILIHCWAGVSRSTAAAYITACALNPLRSELQIARALRAASPTATPNARLVALADARLGRGGRMVAAVQSIGRGADCAEGVPFALELA